VKTPTTDDATILLAAAERRDENALG